ncbi:myogenesis-regulating glycosidase [Neodiprion fabricii]|uniref:myogenesis-regulating glycosidase n=1 Tax=Neodiprion fabricii TaxID=2872261 RepID=UPI001ED9370E|nr:myogenesis-regulating glycosidase [Neodiprion fabricii]
MDRINRRRRKAKKPKKLLLSTVDPWDVQVASFEPEGLAQRRGVSLSSIVTSPDVQTPSGRVLRTPSPWYKPGTNSPAPNTADTDQGALTSPEWPLPWYKPLRSSTLDTPRGSTQSVPPLKPPRSRANSRGQSTDSVDNETGSKTDGNFTPSGVKVPIVQFHLEDEKIPPVKTNGVQFHERERNFLSVPKIVVSEDCDTEESPKIKENGTFSNSSIKLTNGTSETESQYDSKNPGQHPLLIVEGKYRTSVESIVEDLVKTRYSPQTARQRRLHRLSPRNSSVHEGEARTDNGRPLSAGTIEIKKTPNSPNIVRIGSRHEIFEPRRNSRKSSISMPDRLDNMEGLEQSMRQQGTSSKFRRDDSDSSVTFSNSGSTPRESALDSDTDDDVNDEELAKVPLQAPSRRKPPPIGFISPAHKMARETIEISGGQSVNSTITSVNSISSLLKEKLQLSIPQALRSSKKQQNADYRLRAFVGILFFSIVFLIGFAYVYYNQHVLQRAYFELFSFNKNDRTMHVYSRKGVELISARLGEGILPETGVFPCLPHHDRPGSVCLEWLQQTRLYLSHTDRDQESTHCYHITWQSLSPSYNPKDCFDWSPKRGHWYGAGQTQNMAYPLEKGASDSSAFVTGDIKKHAFGNVLRRYFLNSKGATIVVDPESPLYVSINAKGSQDFCIEAKYDSFAYINHLTPLPQLNYTVCASDNIKTLLSMITEKAPPGGPKKEDVDAVNSLISEPVWQISPTDEAAIYNYTVDVNDHGFLQGHVLLSEGWQPNSGDFHLDMERFPTMVKTIKTIHRRGFRIIFSIQPFISTESVNFVDTVASRLLISERGSDPRIPALTRYKQSNSAAILDITNDRTLPWLEDKLQSLVNNYKVDSFYLDLGNAYDMPHYYKCQKPLTNPDHYKTLFTEAILSSVPVIGVSGAITRPKTPVFVSLPPFPSSWKAIKTVIPTVLSYGIIGYPFIMPGAVGGDVALPMSDNNPNNDFEVNLPDKELYLRWLQLSTFLPVIRFTHLPSKYSNESVLEMAKSLTTLRQKTVKPLLTKYALEAFELGLPIIRPLWMLDPSDPACHDVVDEFSVGEELIVAPILYSGSRQREVYLPAGVWRDGIDGTLKKGSRWIHNYRVAEDKVAYFVKMPDNTRF